MHVPHRAQVGSLLRGSDVETRRRLWSVNLSDQSAKSVECVRLAAAIPAAGNVVAFVVYNKG